MDMSVRFCSSSRSGATDANDQSVKVPDFLRFETFAYDRWNSTITYEPGRDVCEWKLINNQTDIFPDLSPYPGDYQYTNHITLMMGGKFTILSAYVPVDRSTAATQGTDSLTGFAFFSSTVILTIITLLAALYSLLRNKVKHKMKFEFAHIKPFVSLDWYIRVRILRKPMSTRPKSRPFIMMMGMMLKQFTASPWIPRKKHWLMIRLIVILTMSTVSVIHFSFVNSERTELVVIEEPHFMDTYESVVEHKTAIPVWLSFTNHYDPFMKSPEGSVTHQIWQKARRNHCRVRIADCLIGLNRANLFEYTTRIARQKIALISAEPISRVIHAGMCPLARMMGLNPLILRTDPNEKSFPLAIGYNGLMDERMPDVAKIITMRGRRTFESGIILKLVIPTKSPIASLTTPSAVRECLFPGNTPPESVFLSKPWTDYWNLLIICLIFHAFAALVLLIARK